VTKTKTKSQSGSEPSSSTGYPFDYSVEKLRKSLDKNWAVNLQPVQKQVLEAYIRGFAVFLDFLDKDFVGEVTLPRQDCRSRPIFSYLKSLNSWIENYLRPLSLELRSAEAKESGVPEGAIQPFDQQFEQQVEQLEKSLLAEAEKGSMPLSVLDEGTSRKSKPRDSSPPNQDVAKLTKAIGKIERDIENLASDVRAVRNDLATTHGVQRTGLAEYREEFLAFSRSTDQELSKLSLRVGPIGDSLALIIESLKGQKDSVETLSARLAEMEKTKIDIRESTQILELRQDVERFVSQDILNSLSKSIMPLLAALKEKPTSDLGDALGMLEEKCKAVGLLGVEDLYR